MSNDYPLITVFKANNQVEAELIKGILASQGIPVLLKYESLGKVYGLTVDGLGQVELQVPQIYAADAEKLISSMPENDDEEPESE